MLKRLTWIPVAFVGLFVAATAQSQTPSAPFKGEGGKIRV